MAETMEWRYVSKYDAGAFYAEETGDPGTNIVVGIFPDGAIGVGVEQEHAVDSYNQSFVSYINLTPEQAKSLLDFLSAALAPDASDKG